MQTHKVMQAAGLVLVLAPSCGSDGSGGADTARQDIESYGQLTAGVQSAVMAYRDHMSSDDVTTVARCEQIHAAYDVDVRASLTQMSRMGGMLDDFMGEHGGRNMADVECTSAGMMGELDRHHAAACRLGDLDADRAEAVRHVGVMTSYGTHLDDRAEEMMNRFEGSTAQWRPMLMGCAESMSAGMRSHMAP